MLTELLKWYRQAWWDEIPSGTPPLTDAPVRGVAPGPNAATVAYLDGHAFGLDEDGYYIRPLHAALARLAYRDSDQAHFLWSIASGPSFVDVPPAGRRDPKGYAIAALRRLRSLYFVKPLPHAAASAGWRPSTGEPTLDGSAPAGPPPDTIAA